MPNPMQITTTYEVKPNHMDASRGALIIHVFINGTKSGELQPISGNLVDIQQFVAGEIDEAELLRRQGFKSKLANEAFDGEVPVEVIRTFSGLGVGTVGDLSYNGAARCYVLDLANRQSLDLPSHVAQNLDSYLKATR